MKQVSELRDSLSEHLKWNKARVDCFTRMLLSLFAVRSVNLSEMAVGFSSRATIGARYKRLQRFFGQFRLDYTVIARLTVQLFFPDLRHVYVTIVRTNWYWGRQKINVFMVAIAYEGLAIPVFWHCLPKAGNSSFAEQKRLLDCFITTFGKDCIAGVLADREFGSGALFEWLIEEKIPFYIRVKEGSRIKFKQTKWRTAERLFTQVNPNQHTSFGLTVWLFNVKLYLAASHALSAVNL